VKVGFYQFAPEPKAVPANLARIRRALSNVEADLLVLPELSLTGYLFESREELRRYAEPVPDGASLAALAGVCQARNLNLVFGIAEAAGTAIYNTAVLLTAGGAVHRYRKAHLFMAEKDVFDRGDTAFPVFDIGGIRVGMLICFDYFFPEAARSLALKGAQVICHPANLVLDYAQSMTLTRAAENRAFWILCNRTGVESAGGRTMGFTGRSQVVDPAGKLLRRAGSTDESLAVIEIDPGLALDKNVTPRNNVITDRRPELYGR
jgi:predicted amidohydrolase